MVLQAYVDDSVEAGKVLVFAGYVASVEQWLLFSDEWKKGLEQAHWPVFKMTEAASGDPDKLLKAGFFYRIIENHVDRLFAIAMDIEGLKRAVRELGLSSEFENPYSLIYPMMLAFTLEYRRTIGIEEPVDFIFDKHGSQAQVEEGFRRMLANTTPELRHLWGQPPRFEDDEKFLPLQAADLLAWHVRKQWLRYGAVDEGPLEMSWPARREMLGLIADMKYDEIKENLHRFNEAHKRNQRGVGLQISFSLTGLDGKKI